MDTKLIPLTQGKFAIVDADDYEEMNQHKWYYHRCGYARRAVTVNGKQVITFMHRIINKTPNGMFTDHINGDRLDNRKANLRTCTRLQNRANQKQTISKAGYKGVNKIPRCERWQAILRLGGKRYYLGSFEKPELAALAYNEAALKHFGEFASLNEVRV